MNYSVEDVNSVKKILHIEVPQDVVAKEIDDAYKTLNKTTKVKGFRPGKAPKSVLEQQYGKDIRADITARLVNTSYKDALEESGFSPLQLPLIEPSDLSVEDGRALCYTATVEIIPEIQDIDFKGLQLKKMMYAPTDEEIDAQLAMLQKNFADIRPVTSVRPAQKGDFVVLDYEGFQNGAPHAELQKTENMTMKIGAGIISDDFDAQITGMSPEESKDFSITFPDNYQKKSLAGQEIAFHVYLNEIREEILPEINDDFAKKTGEFQTVEDLKSAMRAHMNAEYAKRSEQEINEQVFAALIEKVPFEVPEILVDLELAGIIREYERSFEQQGVTLESQGINKQILTASYQGVAERTARRHLILEKIISQEKLTLSEDELDSELRKVAIACSRSQEEMRAYYHQNPLILERLKSALLEKHAIALIVDHATIEEVTPVLEYPEKVQEALPAQE